MTATEPCARCAAQQGDVRFVAIHRHIAAELVRAFAVLALVFLSFGHQPAAAVPSDHDVLTVAVTASFCGDAPADTSHAPCHACRIGGGADLPPPCEGLIHLPAVAEPAFPELAAVAYVVAPPDIPDARGPPALA
jgi:hypothetical protein